MYYHQNNFSQDRPRIRYRDKDTRNRIIGRRAQKKVARERHPGSKFEYRNGILYFAGTTERVSGSIMIQKPKKVQKH